MPTLEAHIKERRHGVASENEFGISHDLHEDIVVTMGMFISLKCRFRLTVHFM